MSQIVRKTLLMNYFQYHYPLFSLFFMRGFKNNETLGTHYKFWSMYIDPTDFFQTFLAMNKILAKAASSLMTLHTPGHFLKV